MASVFQAGLLLQHLQRTSKWALLTLASPSCVANNHLGGLVFNGPHRNVQSVASSAQTSGQDLRHSLKMTMSETKRILDNFAPICADPIALLTNPGGEAKFKRNLELVDGLGQEIWEVKRWLSGM